MNKYEKARQYARQTMDDSFHMEATILEVLEELVERAKPKKPFNTGDTFKHCPNCKKINVDYAYNYCSGCGQALDWSD